jgi:uncharacterized protein (TIGR02145 family)
MRQVDKKYFGDVQSGRLNADDSPFAITTNEWVNAENIRSGTTDKGFTGIVESIGGNVELPKPLPFNNLDSVVIGTQTWTSKSLDVTTFANGEAITQAKNSTEWTDFLFAETPAWAYWDYNESNASLGKYYNLFAINSLKGLAPKGWHIPSSVELQKLYDFVLADLGTNSAYALREKGLTHWGNNEGTDNYGFSMQGNSAHESGNSLREYGYFPTSNNKAANFIASVGNAGITDAEAGWGYNVRLLKDKEYTEVKIGEQVWIGENYEGICYRNGELIPEVTDQTTWDALTTGAWCWYNNNESTYGQYGRLYNRYAIIDPRGFAPEGYSMPSSQDFNILSTYLGGDAVAGAKMKETGTSHWNSPNSGSTNTSGFTALPASGRGVGGFAVGIFGIGELAVFNQLDTNINRGIFNNNDYFDTIAFGGDKAGVSVRLLKNQYITIGSVEDTENNRILYFNCNISPNGADKITCLYTDTNTQYDVLYGFQVTGGLNFSKDSLIHSAKMSGNILSWVEGTVNEPRKINIESAIKANYVDFETDANPYIYPLNFSEITMIKRPPIFTPNIFKSYDDSFANNFIANDSFEFAFQYEYYDGETSVVGSYSQASRLNTPIENSNRIEVFMDSLESIPSIVKRINLIARRSDGKPTNGQYAFVAKTWDKTVPYQLTEIQNQSIGKVLSFSFYNDITGNVLATDDVTRNFDLVPVYSQTHEVAKSRYFLANNTLGYTTPKTSSLDVRLGNLIGVNDTGQSFPAIYFAAGNYNSENEYWHWVNVAYYLYIAVGQYTPGYYILTTTQVIEYNYNSTTPPTPGAIPGGVAFAPLTFAGSTWSDVVSNRPPAYFFPRPNDEFYAPNYQNSSLTNDYVAVTGLSGSFYNVLTHNSTYKMGVVFYDYAMRSCGVSNLNYNTKIIVTGDVTLSSVHVFSLPQSAYRQLQSGQKINIAGLDVGDGEYTVVSISVNPTNFFITVAESIPTFTQPADVTISYLDNNSPQLSVPIRNYAYETAYQNGIWTLENTYATQEIPEWAYYYSIVKTLNLRTRFFIQSFSNSLKYVTRNSDGTYAYNSTYQTNQTIAIGINTAALLFSGLGYTYTEGDVCTLFAPSTTYQLPVLRKDGNYIHIQPKDIGTFGSLNHVEYHFEIYTPYKEGINEFFYEFGEIYNIVNPKTENRQYSILTSSIPPDSYVLKRNYTGTEYNAGAMSPNDIYWQKWISDSGKQNLITILGQSVKNTNIVWSDTYITGTQINGSSTFRFGNDTYVSDDCGSINKLQLTSKVQDQGSVMLSLCSVETNSMYLGETQITDSTGAVQFFSGAQNVISTINTMKGNYGCVDPASVVQYRGNVYFLDASNGRWVQYSANGLDNISSVKMSRFWKNWCLKYLSMGKSEIEAFGDRPFVFATVDPFHDELLVSIPKLSNTPPQGYLPDYPDMVYPFDILDYEGKTVVYKLGTGAVVQPHWQGAYTFTVENFITLQNRLFTFKNGLVYEHNQPTNIVNQNTFFGDYFPSKIMFTSNILPQLPKVYDNFVSESNLVPNFVYFYNNYPKLQMSDLDNTSFINLEGVWYAVILRNKRVDTGTSYTYDGLLTAEVMRNTNMYVLTEFSPTTEILQLRLLQLGTTISKGHTI